MAIQPQDPSGIAEPDIGPARDDGDKKGRGKGEGRASQEEKPHPPLIGFAAGLCSGWTKSVVGHPFDTIKTRLQRTPVDHDQGASHCFTSTIKKEEPRALYKGASVPAISWDITHSILMGSLHDDRAVLRSNGFAERDPYSKKGGQRISLLGHTIAEAFAGWTNAVIAHPTETIKCKLQLQMVQTGDAATHFAGPIDVVRQTIHGQGITGMWKGVGASFIDRSCFAAMFGGFEIFNRMFKKWEGTSQEMSPNTGNFMAGGLASSMYWLTALPLDNVKNRVMVDSIKKPRFSGLIDAYRQTWRGAFNPFKSFSWNAIARTRNFYKGSVPVIRSHSSNRPTRSAVVFRSSNAVSQASMGSLRRYSSKPGRHITILGSGLTGLYTAYRLSLSPGTKITLLDSASRVGGWVDSRNRPVKFSNDKGELVQGEVTLESGPRSIRPRASRGAPGMLKLIRDLGLEDEIMPVPHTHPAAKNRFLLDTKTSELIKLPSSLPSLLTSRHPLVSHLLPSVLKEPFRRRPSSDMRDESLDSFITRRLGPGVAHMLSAMIHGIYAASSKDLSVRSGMGVLWDSESKWGSVVLGMLGGTKSKFEKAAEQKDWDELGALGKEREKWSLYGLRGGIGVITNGLYDRIRQRGVDVRLNQEITKIEPTESGTLITTTDGTIASDHTISAIPPTSLDPLLSAPLPHLSHNPYTSVGVVSLVFPGKPQSYHPDGFGYLIPRSDATANPEGILGVVFDSTAVPGVDDVGLDGQVTKLTVMMGGPYWAAYGVSKRPEDPELLVEPALRHLRRTLPALANIEPLVISPRLHVDAIPTYLPGHGQRLKEVDSAITNGPWQDRLSLAGNGYGGIGVNDCIWSGEGVASALLANQSVTGLERWRNWK